MDEIAPRLRLILQPGGEVPQNFFLTLPAHVAILIGLPGRAERGEEARDKQKTLAAGARDWLIQAESLSSRRRPFVLTVLVLVNTCWRS